MQRILLAGVVALAWIAPCLAAETSSNGRIQVAAIFGESDEEKAARQQHEDNQDLSIQSLTQRVHDLEATLRQQTGQNEQLSHQIQLLNEKIERQQKDFEYRLCAMAAQQLGAPAGGNSETALPCNPGTAAVSATPTPEGQKGTANAETPQFGKPPGVLGTLSTNDGLALAAPAPNVRAQYDAGMNLLAKAQYDEASAAFRNFADQYPKDPLASSAVYWIGRINYVQKDYTGAARSFAEVIKKWPVSSNAPESLLKLGQSLLAAGQKKEGCTALVALKKKYPHAAKNLIQEASEAHKAACVR